MSPPNNIFMATLLIAWAVLAVALMWPADQDPGPGGYVMSSGKAHASVEVRP
jgi:hypothetical protein